LLRWAASSFRNDIQHTESLKLQEITQQNIDLLQSSAITKNIRIINQIQASIQAVGNYDQINIVIRNLVANAIKFTHANGCVTLSAIDKENTVEVSIVDTGVGMTEEQLSKLFTHSYSSTYGTTGEKGIGLGLLLCKEYIETNNGSISVSSEINKGSIFTVILPKNQHLN